MRFVTPQLDEPIAYPKAVRRAVAQKQLAVRQEWREHNERIRPLLPTGLQFLLDFSLDDALVLSLRLDPLQKTLALTLYAGDAQRGYFKLLLHYDNIALTRAETQLLCLIVHAADDIYWGELDIVEGDEPLVFIHRLLWHSSIKMDRDGCCFQPEIELRFGGFELEVTPLPDGRTAKRDTDFIQVVRDPDYIEGLN